MSISSDDGPEALRGETAWLALLPCPPGVRSQALCLCPCLAKGGGEPGGHQMRGYPLMLEGSYSPRTTFTEGTDCILGSAGTARPSLCSQGWALPLCTHVPSTY